MSRKQPGYFDVAGTGDGHKLVGWNGCACEIAVELRFGNANDLGDEAVSASGANGEFEALRQYRW